VLEQVRSEVLSLGLGQGWKVLGEGSKNVPFTFKDGKLFVPEHLESFSEHQIVKTALVLASISETPLLETTEKFAG
jgi:hypothetical protein